MKLPRPGGVLKKLSLRGRFALLSAVSVSIAIIVAALASYFLVSAQLNNQVNQVLARIRPPDLRALAGSTAPAQNCGAGAFQGFPGDEGGGPAGGPSSPFSLEYVDAAGHSCATNSDLSVKPSDTQKAVAAGTLQAPLNHGVFYDTYTTGGEHVRVYTVQIVTGTAVSNIGSLSEVDSALSQLTLWLVVAAAGGVAVATMAGLVVARSAVKPVRRLTRAVEHVARTEDLSVKLPIDGKDEINRLGAAFNNLTRSLATSRDRQRRLIADAGHELRTPLTSLRTNVDLLIRSERTGRELPAGRRETMLVSVDQQLHELSGLVTDLLELARGQERGTRRTMRVALHESVSRAIDRARLRGPGLHFDIAIEPWFVQGDPTAVDRAVLNLLDNAVKFSPAEGTVTVRLHAGEYTVTDQGPGIDPADLPYVFDRFWRSESARSLPGSGLGLAIVSHVAEESGGKVSLQPAPGGGTVARLWLPGNAGLA
ncbi:MAG TPA: HAMP domain-containing sensor histidine kinase [Actinocrinis sp.]|uniref:sensor histidine kinase n=1 Tax=Actinocrinis sp. TaxID=1920516 RepID=UPI002DDD9272|nr:HAMP domain-containing sensor histidine kinase [Actinocrinis sp.]HEV2346189.1 HAMP domain-containing sensor histidine kinase [Actinocrinis sp.]